MTEETLFELARKTPEEERQALLDRACEGNPELRQRVEALLRADAGSSPLSQPSPTLNATTGFHGTASYSSSDPVPGILIAGRYSLEQKLGEGGMGEVWVAKQSEPIKRKVALKLIKAGMDSKAVVQRFEQERQALALMDHPSIAKVLDGGSTEQRQPFFVMELVNGLPLTRFCDEAKLGIRERLELFVPICQAVQHAHQKGIVHRDLKPSNILVTMIDGKPTPKVIDFGVAKATGGKLTDESLSTQFGAVIGTLEYMSPEQAGYSNQDVDTRADIYSLGVILYELLTGLRPFDSKRLKKAALDEMIRMIREEEPSKPSTRLSTDESLPSLAATRLIEPAKLTALLRGELDWVVMKCLEKQRDRRYETASGLARDIQRYLVNETLDARPPSVGYRLRKFVSRNRGKVLAAGLVFLTLIIGIIGTSWGFWQAERQRVLAVEAEHKERERAEGERSAKEQAERRLKQIEKSNTILGSVFESLDPKEIAESLKPLQAVLVENLAKAAEQLEGEAIGDPNVVAAMQGKIGSSLLALGEPAQAVILLQKACKTYETNWGTDHPETLSCMNSLAKAYQFSGKPTHALPLFEKALNVTKARLGSNNRETLAYMNNVATANDDAGNFDEAFPLFKEALRISKTTCGADDPLTLTIMNNLAGAYSQTNQLKQALPLYEETLRLRKSRLGPSHPDTLRSMNNLASTYWQAEQLDKSIPLLEEVLQHKNRFLGRDHPSTLLTIANLGVNLKDAGRYREALPLLEETYQTRKKYPNFNGFCKPLFECYISMRLAEPAKALVNDVVTYARNQFSDNNPPLAIALAEIGISLLQVNASSEAEPLLRECLAIREKKEPEAWTTFYTQSMLGGVLLGQKKHAEAEPLLLKGYQGMKAREKTIPPQASTRLPEALDRLIQLYTETSKPDEVKKWQAEKDKISKTPEKK